MLLKNDRYCRTALKNEGDVGSGSVSEHIGKNKLHTQNYKRGESNLSAIITTQTFQMRPCLACCCVACSLESEEGKEGEAHPGLASE